jgi:hypothetical protein
VWCEEACVESERMRLGGSGGLEGKIVVLEIYNGTRLQILPELTL